jgi:acyl carrier protein
VVTTSGVVPPGVEAEFPDIGRPISGSSVYLLDDRQQPVAVGEAGELYIGGKGVARGYRHRPNLTAERFVPDPWRPGTCMYRTGDRVRLRPDGTLMFLGRTDDQIKVRGYRIEPQEIAVALERHAGVRRSVVTATATDRNELQLVAYVQFHPGASPGPGELRTFLRGLLPEYMIPTVFVAVEEFPLSSSGKINVHALPAPDSPHRMKNAEFAVCRTPLEQDVAAILAALLRVELVGAQDNFFLLGGHSLLGTQLIVRVRETFGVELPLRTLFDHPTVAELAMEIERRRASAAQAKAA